MLRPLSGSSAWSRHTDPFICPHTTSQYCSFSWQLTCRKARRGGASQACTIVDPVSISFPLKKISPRNLEGLWGGAPPSCPIKCGTCLPLCGGVQLSAPGCRRILPSEEIGPNLGSESIKGRLSARRLFGLIGGWLSAGLTANADPRKSYWSSTTLTARSQKPT